MWLNDVEKASADLDSKLVTVWSAAALDTEALLAAVDATGKQASLAGAPAAAAAGAAEEIVLGVEGMMCEHCVSHVGGALEGVPGVTAAQVDLEASTATVVGVGVDAVDALIAAVGEAGYPAKLLSPVGAAAPPPPPDDARAKWSSQVADDDGRSAAPPSARTGEVAVGIPLEAGGVGAVRRGLFATGASPVMRRLTGALVGHQEESAMLSIQGMTCAACVGAVERALTKAVGVSHVSVSLMGKRGQVVDAAGGPHPTLTLPAPQSQPQPQP